VFTTESHRTIEPAYDRIAQPAGGAAAAPFNYQRAFDRNIWLTEREQATLATKRVAIAGMGGVGGYYVTSLARLGITKFHISDLDHFEVANFNRQAGAMVSTLGRPKVDVMAEVARDINPHVELNLFREGVNEQNLERFFEGVDLYVDGLDAFAFDARERVFAYCARKGIPAVSVAPLGMSAALLVFVPGRMTFEEYFRLEGCSPEEKAIRFLVGFAPALLHRGYLVDASRVNLSERRGPSTGLACQLCAGIATAEATKILIGRGRVYAAPYAVQFDAFRNRLKRTWRPGGNRHPLNRAAIAIAKHQLGI